MKKWLRGILAGFVLANTLVFAACGTTVTISTDGAKTDEAGETEAAAAEEKDLLARIQEKGEMVVACEGAWAPWNYHDENDELVGFDVEVAKLVAEKLGVEATFIEGEWDGLFAGLDAERYDIVANGVEYLEDRAAKYRMSEPYAYIRTALIVQADNEEIKTFEDLNGKTTANSINSTYMLLAEDYGATCSGVDTLNETLEMVLAGRVDATLNAEVSYYDYINVHPDAALKVAALTEEASTVHICMRKGDDTASFEEAVNKAVKELKEEGKIGEVSVKYFGSDISRE